MAGTIISGSHLTGIVLSNAATENPATIAAGGYVTNTTTAYGGDAVFGLAGTAWRVTNLGTVNATGRTVPASFSPPAAASPTGRAARRRR